jgi:CDP-glycerol glycerophosphotransferase (TagB/SpsB family)
MEDLRKEFENYLNERCVTSECETDEDNYEYPDYVEAINAELMPPNKSGVYISRWDLKMVGDAIDASIAMDARARMFKMLMRSVHDKETMEQLLGAFSSLIDAKIEPYREMMQAYPSTREIFEEKIEKAERLKASFEKILETYFPEGE